MPRAERERIVDEHVRLVHLEGFDDRYPRELSGGMQQRVAIAQTLACKPEILLMDEPFGALDAQTRRILQDELRRIWRRDTKTVLFVTHDVEEAVALGTRIVVMAARPGRIKEVLTRDFDVARRRRVRGQSRPSSTLKLRIWRSVKEEVEAARAGRHRAVSAVARARRAAPRSAAAGAGRLAGWRRSAGRAAEVAAAVARRRRRGARRTGAHRRDLAAHLRLLRPRRRRLPRRGRRRRRRSAS